MTLQLISLGSRSIPILVLPLPGPVTSLHLCSCTLSSFHLYIGSSLFCLLIVPEIISPRSSFSCFFLSLLDKDAVQTCYNISPYKHTISFFKKIKPSPILCLLHLCPLCPFRCHPLGQNVLKAVWTPCLHIFDKVSVTFMLLNLVVSTQSSSTQQYLTQLITLSCFKRSLPHFWAAPLSQFIPFFVCCHFRVPCAGSLSSPWLRDANPRSSLCSGLSYPSGPIKIQRHADHFQMGSPVSASLPEFWFVYPTAHLIPFLWFLRAQCCSTQA